MNRLLSFLGYYSSHSELVRSSSLLYKSALSQSASADVMAWFRVAPVQSAGQFPQWWALHSMHVWLVLRRLMPLDKDKKLAQYVFDSMWSDIEMKVC